MQEFSLGRGKKKVVAKFGTKEGLKILSVALVLAAVFLVLFFFGVLRVD